MTPRKLHFLWFDDDQERVERYRPAIERAEFTGYPRADLKPIVITRNLIEVISELDQVGVRADLIIMDHIFSRARGMSLKLNGASTAHLVRKLWPEVPIVCITAMLPDHPRKLDQDDLSEYVEVYAFGQLGDRLEMMFAIARDFKLLRAKRGDYRRQLVAHLKPPKSEVETLMRTLPNEFRSQAHKTSQHRVARWIVGALLSRPGFLYDRLRAATLVGLTETGFGKVEELFRDALYRGPFSTISRPLWWVRALTDLVFEKAVDASATTTQLAGRSLPRVDEADHSVCYVDKPHGDIPNTVARLAPSEELRAVAAKHTKRDPEDVAAIPGFETLLVVES
jgi:hypothetical protein